MFTCHTLELVPLSQNNNLHVIIFAGMVWWYLPLCNHNCSEQGSFPHSFVVAGSIHISFSSFLRFGVCAIIQQEQEQPRYQMINNLLFTIYPHRIMYYNSDIIYCKVVYGPWNAICNWIVYNIMILLFNHQCRIT